VQEGVVAEAEAEDVVAVAHREGPPVEEEVPGGEAGEGEGEQ
jgi:hypothetical protein